MKKKFAALCAVLLVLAMSVQVEAKCRRCRGGKCKTCTAVSVEPAETK